MHPILGHGRRLPLYLAAWLPGAALLAVAVAWSGEVGVGPSLLLALPVVGVYAFVCLAAWYPARSVPLAAGSAWRAISTHLAGALLSSALWQLAAGLWCVLLSRSELLPGATDRYLVLLPSLFAVGLLLYFLAAAASYLVIAFAASRAAEARAFEARRENALAARELELARALQRRLLPPPHAAGAGWRLVARNLAARFVAGDFYDHYALPDGTVRLAVADVAGKGMAASLVMATVKAVLPLIAAGRSVTDTLGALNRKLTGELSRHEFVALAFAAYDPQSGRLEIANAGLPDPYLLRRGAAPRALEVAQPRLPLGIRDSVPYARLVTELAVGDRVVFLTDGLPEAPDAAGDPLGYEGFEALLGGDEELSPWVDGLLERVRAASAGEPDDDWTVVVLERLAAAVAPPEGEG